MLIGEQIYLARGLSSYSELAARERARETCSPSLHSTRPTFNRGAFKVQQQTFSLPCWPVADRSYGGAEPLEVLRFWWRRSCACKQGRFPPGPVTRKRHRVHESENIPFRSSTLPDSAVVTLSIAAAGGATLHELRLGRGRERKKKKKAGPDSLNSCRFDGNYYGCFQRQNSWLTLLLTSSLKRRTQSVSRFSGSSTSISLYPMTFPLLAKLEELKAATGETEQSLQLTRIPFSLLSSAFLAFLAMEFICISFNLNKEGLRSSDLHKSPKNNTWIKLK